MTGEDIKNLREKLGLSQKDFGKKIGASRQTVVNYENGGNIPLAKLELLKKLEEIKGDVAHSFFIEKDGVKFYLQEMTVAIARNKEDALQDEILNGIIENEVSKRLLKITSSRENFLDYLNKK